MVAGGKHQEIRRSNRAILQARAFGHEALDLIELEQPDFSADDQSRATDVQVVTAAAPAIFHLMAGLVLAQIVFETARD